MPKNESKINQRVALIILAVMAIGLFNICLVTLRAKVAEAAPAPKFFYSSDTCAWEKIPEDRQTLNRQSAPMPTCCLERGKYYDAIIKTNNNKPMPISLIAAGWPSNDLAINNPASNNAPILIYPPPALRALATTIIRE